MKKLYIDGEFFSAADLKKVGTYRYAEDPSTEILLVQYARPTGAVAIWSPAEGEALPDDLRQYLLDPTVTLVAHKSGFDRIVLSACLERAGYLTADEAAALREPRRWYCTMTKALSVGLPGALAMLCEVLELPEDQAKLAEGGRLIQRFCKPAPKNHKAYRYDHVSHPELWARFREYGRLDVIAMREIDRIVPDWNFRGQELELWYLDQRVNDRGFLADRALCEAGVRAAEVEKAQLTARFHELTRGFVEKPTQREQFRQYLNSEFGLDLADTQSNTFKWYLENRDLDPRCAELMRISQMANKSSTAKYKALLPAICADGRFRGGLQYNGAARTRRWAGRIFQPQNLPSRGLPKSHLIAAYIDWLKAGLPADLFAGAQAMTYGAASIRGLVTAPSGQAIVAADLSNIEGRILAWLAGEGWKLQAFRDYDAGTGPDLYNITATSIIGGDPWKVAKANRNVFGKVPDLAFGYAGGVGAGQTFAKTYGVKISDYWTEIQKNISPEIIEAARKAWQKRGQQSDIPDNEWIATETVKIAWRRRHPATAALWYACEEACRNAINAPDTTFAAGPLLKFRVTEHQGFKYLRMLLPSGRFVCFFEPRLEGRDICFLGIDADQDSPTYGRWTVLKTYGGHLVENACFAGDVPVLTERGWVPIRRVRRADRVWDGASWVRHGGLQFQGVKEVGTWLGIRVTHDHQILVGSSWRRVIDLDESATHAALSSARDSAPSQSSCPGAWPANTRTFAATVAMSIKRLLGRFTGVVLSVVQRVAWRERRKPECGSTSSQRRNCGRYGRTATEACSSVACAQSTPLSTTMADAASPPTRSGFGTGPHSSTMSCASPERSTPRLSWTDSITAGVTSLGIFDWLGGSRTPETVGPTDTWFGRGGDTPSPSFTNGSSPNGGAPTLCPTTSPKVAPPKRLWRATGERIPVYDLLDCGPERRFLILTSEGPVLAHNCQSTARDVLADNLPAVEAAGFNLLLTVHDEVVTEGRDGTHEHLSQIIATNPPWAGGLPLSAAGFSAPRYKKDD